MIWFVVVCFCHHCLGRDPTPGLFLLLALPNV
jgi:hypothetical protein